MKPYYIAIIGWMSPTGLNTLRDSLISGIRLHFCTFTVFGGFGCPLFFFVTQLYFNFSFIWKLKIDFCLAQKSTGNRYLKGYIVRSHIFPYTWLLFILLSKKIYYMLIMCFAGNEKSIME